MDIEYSYRLSQLTTDMQINIVHPSSDFETVRVYSGDVHRPGLQLTGYFDHFDPDRLQLIGNMEMAYMQQFTPQTRLRKWKELFKHKIPALIMCRSLITDKEQLIAADEYDVTILSSDMNTTDVMSDVIRIVRKAVAPRVTRSGVLVEVYGIGVLLFGESGVGKSEAAVELLKRGHRLIADDAVEIKAIDADVVEGVAPELIRHYVELRGIGVIDVRQIFGVGAVKDSQVIHLVVTLEQWQEGADYDRLGINENTVDILGVKVPAVTIPVAPGRNLAVILEVAAMNQRQKLMGYNAAVEFIRQIDGNYDEVSI
jgi:HPr kinase/phosphorylase